MIYKFPKRKPGFDLGRKHEVEEGIAKYRAHLQAVLDGRKSDEKRANIPRKLSKLELDLALAHMLVGDDEEAATYFQASMESWPNLPAAMYLAACQERLHRYDEAIATYDRALRLFEGDDNAGTMSTHRGRLLFLSGRDDEAAEALETATQLDHGQRHNWIRLRTIESGRGTANDAFDPTFVPLAIAYIIRLEADFERHQAILEILAARGHSITVIFDQLHADVDSRLARIRLVRWFTDHPNIRWTNIRVTSRDNTRRLTKKALARGASSDMLSRIAGRLVDRSTDTAAKAEMLVWKDWLERADPDLVVLAHDPGNAPPGMDYAQAVIPQGHRMMDLSLAPGAPVLSTVDGQRAMLSLCCDNELLAFASREDAARFAAIHGVPSFDALVGPAPSATESRRLREALRLAADRPFILFQESEEHDAATQYGLAVSLANRLRDCGCPQLRDHVVVYRPAGVTAPPDLRSAGARLCYWPMPMDREDYLHTSDALRVGLHECTAVIAGAAADLLPAIAIDRPCLLLAAAEGRAEAARLLRDEPAFAHVSSLSGAIRQLSAIMAGEDRHASHRAALKERLRLPPVERAHQVSAAIADAIEQAGVGRSVAEIADQLRRAARARGFLPAAPLQLSEEKTSDFVDSALQALVANDLLAPLQFALGRASLIEFPAGSAGVTPTARGLVAIGPAIVSRFPGARLLMVGPRDQLPAFREHLRQVWPALTAQQLGESGVGHADVLLVPFERLGEMVAFSPCLALFTGDPSAIADDHLRRHARDLAALGCPLVATVSAASDEVRRAQLRQAAVLGCRYRLRGAPLVADTPDGLLLHAGLHQDVLAGRTSATGWNILPTFLYAPPTVSISMLAYGGERYVGEALESLLSQSFTDFELVVCDDASPDGTLAVIAGYAATDPRISIVPSDRNRGAGANIRRALDHARGTYFCWVSDHDFYGPTWLEDLVGALDRHPDAVLAYPYAGAVDAVGERISDELRGFDTRGIDPVPRLRRTLVDLRAAGTKMYGLYRLDALRRVRVHTTAWWDRLLLNELAALGHFVQVGTIGYWRRFPEILRRELKPEVPGKLGFAPDTRSTRDTLARQFRTLFADGRVPLWKRLPSLWNAISFVVDTCIAPPGATPRLWLLGTAVIYGLRTRTFARFTRIEARLLVDHLLMRR